MDNSDKNCNSGEWDLKMGRLVELIEEAIVLSGDLKLDLLSHITRMALLEAFNQKTIRMR